MIDIAIRPWHWHDRFGRKDGTGKALPKNALGEGPRVGNCSPFSYAVSDDQGFVVAHCTGPLVTMSAERSEQHARLLADAPELFEIAERLIEWWQLPATSEITKDDLVLLKGIVDRARVTLARIEDKQ